MTRSAFNKSENKRLIDKSQRLEGIVEAMKDRGESEEYIAEVIVYCYLNYSYLQSVLIKK